MTVPAAAPRGPAASSVPPARTVEAPSKPSSPAAAYTVEISAAGKVKQLYASGLSVAQIAARTGLPVDTIRRYLGL